MDYREITGRYYDKWIGREGIFSRGDGVEFVYSDERNVKQYGYPEIFDVYALARPGRMVISYGDGAADGIERLRAEVGETIDVDGLKAALEQVYGKKPAHSVKFVYSRLPEGGVTARALAAEDRENYIGFWGAAHPGAKTDWINEFYDEMVADGTTFVSLAGDRIVSCADAPGMPYMTDEVQEIGVATLAEFRRQGHGFNACVAAARKHISDGKCPIWSAAWDNTASHRLAERVGFVKYADAVMLCLK